MLNNNLINNVLSLACIKGLQYILAFVTFPYLTRVLQVENFGAVVFAQGIIQYFVLLTDYGFNLIAPRDIAMQDDMEERGKVFASIFFSKVVLLAFSSVFFGISLLVLNMFYGIDIILYLLTFTLVIGYVLYPIWFFQGIQQMKYITFVDVLAKIISLCGIFYFVNSAEDYLIAAFFQAINPLIAAVASWCILYKNYPEVFCLTDIKSIKAELLKGWSVFISSIAINLYTASNLVFLGMLTNNTVVGYFSGAKKIIDNITALFSPITQAVYPHISKLAAESKLKALEFIKKVFLLLGVGNFLLSLFICIFADWIIKTLLGVGYEQSVMLLRIMAFLPFIIALSNVFGVQTMLPFGMQSTFSKILMGAAGLNTVIVVPAIYFLESVGVSISIMVTECVVTGMMFFALNKHGLKIWGKL
ncbi:flippase [Phascolarctobacterium faecium]|uniref:flippase n=1 Tax=Phascolarctobacterium faecium TaxID=33025 RepID=UPI003AEF2E4F